jgi:hypothetical protein
MPWRDRLRRAPLQECSWPLTGLSRAGAAHPLVWRRVARTCRPGYSRVAAWHARVACQLAGVDGPACRDFLAGSGAAGARRLREDPAAGDIRIRVFEPGQATAMFLGATRGERGPQGPEVVRRAT